MSRRVLLRFAAIIATKMLSRIGVASAGPDGGGFHGGGRGGYGGWHGGYRWHEDYGWRGVTAADTANGVAAGVGDLHWVGLLQPTRNDSPDPPS